MRKDSVFSFGVPKIKVPRLGTLIVGLWLAGVSSLFGGVSISLVPPSTNPDCTGAVTVQGNVDCGNCYGPQPTVTVVNALCGGSDSPSVNVSCQGHIWTGTWGPTSISLAKGVNVITATDSPCGDSASISVASSGGSGASFQISASMGCPLHDTSCGAFINFTFCCLTAGDNYTWAETITGGCTPAGSCGGGPSLSWQEAAGSPCVTVPDTCAGPCPGGFAGNGSCTCVQNWTLTDTTSGTVVASGTITRVFTASLGPPATITVTLSGDLTFSGHCP
jgi:hypothetical protein